MVVGTGEEKKKKNRATMGSLQMHKHREREGKEEPRRIVKNERENIIGKVCIIIDIDIL